MKITYISHATLLIEVDGFKIVTDPWVKGAVYCNQWHLFPKALSPQLIQDANSVVYSHGHEDHLHAQSLQTINTQAQIFYPYSWYSGTKEFFNGLGFSKIHEVFNEQRIEITPNIHITYLSNNLDNVIVFEINNQVVLNINDALPSASEQMINYFIQKITKRWPKIDYIFSSYGGAAYFPNTVHYISKNDVEIAKTRELFFVTNFCKIVSALQPRFAVPFASDFVLLDDNQRWINDCKFPREEIRAFYKNYSRNADTVEVVEAYPDDYFESDVFFAASPYHTKKLKGRLLNNLDQDYAEEISNKRKTVFLNETQANVLFDQLRAHILNKHYIIPAEVKTKLKFAIRVTDVNGENCLLVNFRKHPVEFTHSPEADKDLDLLIDIRSKTLLYSLNNEWGGDAIIIGYGAEITIYNEDAIIHEYENYCVRLLSRYPNTKEYLKKNPLRALRYLISDEVKRKNLFNKLFQKGQKTLYYTEPRLGDRNLWLNKDKCDVCKACNI